MIALGTRRLDQLNISNFEDYTKQLPSVSFLTTQPGVTTVYMRGVSAAGGTNAEGNHSGPLPQVGTYLDEQPVTTIGGTLDVHIYDVARIESLSGPQGTLYGASSEAGTIRIITNKPELGVTTGRVDGELNSVAHGGMGGKLEGMINIPIATRIAFRGVAFYEHDAGYIDNVFGSRQYCGDAVKIPDPDNPGKSITVGCVHNGIAINNANLVKKNFNDQDIYGGRAALKVDLDDNWTVTPTFMYQKLHANGVFFYDPNIGDLKIDRFRKEVNKDRFWQAALTVEGKIANFDVTYAGAYMDRPTYSTADYTDYSDAYDRLYESEGGLANYFYFQDAAGNTISPQQFIVGTNHFKKLSQELRFASPADKPFRVIGGAFYQDQKNFIHQDYQVTGLAPDLSVNGHPGTLWLTQQKREDKDYALFGEASYDVVPHVTLTAGTRWYKYDNTLIGFFGFGRNPGDDFTAEPFNAAASSHTGVVQCFTVNGERLGDAIDAGHDTTLIAPIVPGSPCTDLGIFANGKVQPVRAKGHRLYISVQCAVEAAGKPHVLRDLVERLQAWRRKSPRRCATVRRGFPDQLRARLEDHVRAAALERRHLPREMEGVPVRLPWRQQLYRNPQCERRADQRRRNGRELFARRTDAECRRCLHGRKNRREHLHEARRDPDPNCGTRLWHGGGAGHRLHRRSERHSTADHAEVQGDRHGALQLAGLGQRQGPRRRAASPIAALRLRRFGRISRLSGPASTSTRTCSRASCTRRPWSISLPASIGRNGASSCSARTSSTSASTSAGRRLAEAARARWSCPDGRGRSDFVPG